MNKDKQRANYDQWMKHVQAWRQSGETQSAYCRRHGLVAVTFSAWVSRDRKSRVGTAAPPTLVPVVMAPAAEEKPDSLVRLEHTSGWQLHLPPDISVSSIGQLLKALT